MKIAHFSDSHAGAPAENWKTFLDKRWVGIFNFYFRRRFQHDQEVLKTAVKIMLKRGADIFICTGDITSTGQASEFEKTLDILSPLIATSKLLYIPGNHDFYVIEKECSKALLEAFRVLNSGRFSLSDLPLKISFPELDIIAVNESYPSNLISSCGFLSKRDSKILLSILEKKDRPVILAGHYPLIEEKPLLRIRHRLWGQKEVLKKLLEGVIDLSLCGHVHKPYYIKTGENGRGEYCVGSVTKTSSFSEIIYEESKNTFTHTRIEVK